MTLRIIKKDSKDFIEKSILLKKDQLSEELRFWEIMTDPTSYHISQSKNIILGREGHIDQTFVFADLSNTRENADLAKSASLDTSFTEGYTYKDYKSGDKIAAAGIGALVATSLGVKALKSSGGAAAAGGILLLLKKFWWILLAPLAFLGKLFGGGDNKQSNNTPEPKRRAKKKDD